MDTLLVTTFSVLRNHFFDSKGRPIRFKLREKKNTQDDPFDEYISNLLDKELKKQGAHCQKAPGPLISPDMVVYKQMEEKIVIFGIEVKKLERYVKNGPVARRTGLDYNSTPPCGTVNIYNSNDKEMPIKCFYLFACLEMDRLDNNYVSAMCLCDGSILNDDYDLYKEITGTREKSIGIGTYGDGANRDRPMLIFANPLGCTLLDHKITLISGLDLQENNGNIGLKWRFIRKDISGNERVFYTYLSKDDIDESAGVSDVFEPFPRPQKREVKTQGRGRFRLLLS